MKSKQLDDLINKNIKNHFIKNINIKKYFKYDEYEKLLKKFISFLIENNLDYNVWKIIHQNVSEISLIINDNVDNLNTALVKINEENSEIFKNREIIKYINSYQEFIIDKSDLEFFKYFNKVFTKIKNEKSISTDLKQLKLFAHWMNINIDYENILEIKSDYPITEYLKYIFTVLKPISKGQHVGSKQKQAFYNDLKEIIQINSIYLFKQNDSLEKIKKSFRFFSHNLFNDEKAVKIKIVKFCKKYSININIFINALQKTNSFKAFETFPQDLFAKNIQYLAIADIANALNINIVEFWVISKLKFENFEYFYTYYVKNCRKNNLYILASFSNFEIFLKKDFFTPLIYKKIINIRKKFLKLVKISKN